MSHSREQSDEMWANCCRRTGSEFVSQAKERSKDSSLTIYWNGVKAANQPSRGEGCYDVLHGLDAVHNNLLSRRHDTRHRWTSTPGTRVEEIYSGTPPTHPFTQLHT